MKLSEIVVHIDNYNFTKFHQNQMKNKKVLLIPCLTDVSSVKVPLRSYQGAGEFGQYIKCHENETYHRAGFLGITLNTKLFQNIKGVY